MTIEELQIVIEQHNKLFNRISDFINNFLVQLEKIEQRLTSLEYSSEDEFDTE